MTLTPRFETVEPDHGWIAAYLKAMEQYADAPAPGPVKTCRGWEFGQVDQAAGWQPEHLVLEVGAYQSYYGLFVQPKVKGYITTDNFSWWNDRLVIRMSGVSSPDKWADYLREKGADVMEADGCHLGWDSNVFDRVVCVSTIEHILDDIGCLKEMRRVLKPGGVLLLTTEVSNDYFRADLCPDGAFTRFYSPETLALLCRAAGFAVPEVINVSPLPAPWRQAFLRLEKT